MDEPQPKTNLTLLRLPKFQVPHSFARGQFAPRSSDRPHGLRYLFIVLNGEPRKTMPSSSPRALKGYEFTYQRVKLLPISFN